MCLFSSERNPTRPHSASKITTRYPSPSPASSTAINWRNNGASTTAYSSEELEPEIKRKLQPWREAEDDETPPVVLSDPPTKTKSQRIGRKTQSPKPTIVVLGASGRVGRQVVQQLMALPQLDARIVAFVRDPIKASRVLYGDKIMAKANRHTNGPQLEVVVGDLFPEYDNQDEETEWLRRAESAAKFYNNTVDDYDDGAPSLADLEEALEDLIKDSSVIINCVGAVRLTNLWKDFLKAPWRLFRHDVSDFCTDTKHPYYSQYLATRKIIRIAEVEQKRREAEREDESQTLGETEYEQLEKKMETPQQRIRFIGVSDLAVSRKPWMVLPIVANLISSMVLRYQDKAEKLMVESPVLDTIVLRPGRLIDQERDEELTHLEVSPTGALPFPAVVSREDVASLAVASALIKSTKGPTFFEALTDPSSNATAKTEVEPFHMTLACRWVGDCDRYGTHGLKADGKKNAYGCMNQILNKSRRLAQRRNKRRRTPNRVAALDSLALYAKRFDQKRSIKPYAVFVALPLYLFLGLLLARMMQEVQSLPFVTKHVAPVVAQKWMQVVAFVSANWKRSLARTATNKPTPHKFFSM